MLDKLIKAIPQLQDAQLAVNPFKTLAKNVKELFTSEKDSDKLEKKIGRLGESEALFVLIERAEKWLKENIKNN